MSRAIFESAISALQAEKEQCVQSEATRVLNEVVIPKNVEFDNEKQAQIVAENERHNKAISLIEETTSAKKQAFEKSEMDKIERAVEDKYHFSVQINALKEIIG